MGSGAVGNRDSKEYEAGSTPVLDSTRVHPFRAFHSSPVYLEFDKFPIPELPYMLEIEPSNICNMNCLFCGRQIMNRPLGYMDYGLYTRLIDEVAGFEDFVGISSFAGWGEPLLHPLIYHMIKYANRAGVKTSLITNGLKLDERVLDAGIDHVKVSFQGANIGEYDKLRKQGAYPGIVRNVEKLVNYRDKNNLHTFIQVSTSVTDESDADIQAFKAFWENVVDEIYVDYTKWQRVLKVERVWKYLQGKPSVFTDGHIRDDYKSKTFRNRPCVDVYTRLVIHQDGIVPVCCSDFSRQVILGDVNDMSLKDVWDSARMAEIRRNIHNLRFCQLCNKMR